MTKLTDEEIARRYYHAVIGTMRYRAKKRVKEQIRARGERVHNYSAREIAEQAEVYMVQHREELKARAQREVYEWPEFGEKLLLACAKLSYQKLLPAS